MNIPTNVIEFIELHNDELSDSVIFLNVLDKTFRNLNYVKHNIDEFKDTKYLDYVTKDNKITVVKYYKHDNFEELLKD